MPIWPIAMWMDHRIRLPSNWWHHWCVRAWNPDRCLGADDTAATNPVCQIKHFSVPWPFVIFYYSESSTIGVALSKSMQHHMHKRDMEEWKIKANRNVHVNLDPELKVKKKLWHRPVVEEHWHVTCEFINFSTLPAKNRLFRVKRYKQCDTPCITWKITINTIKWEGKSIE